MLQSILLEYGGNNQMNLQEIKEELKDEIKDCKNCQLERKLGFKARCSYHSHVIDFLMNWNITEVINETK